MSADEKRPESVGGSWIEQRAGIAIRVEEGGSCAPATAFEQALWTELQAIQQVDDAMVERAARALHARVFTDKRNPMSDWNNLSEFGRNEWIEPARVALLAAVNPEAER